MALPAILGLLLGRELGDKLLKNRKKNKTMDTLAGLVDQTGRVGAAAGGHGAPLPPEMLPADANYKQQALQMAHMMLNNGGDRSEVMDYLGQHLAPGWEANLEGKLLSNDAQVLGNERAAADNEYTAAARESLSSLIGPEAGEELPLALQNPAAQAALQLAGPNQAGNAILSHMPKIGAASPNQNTPESMREYLTTGDPSTLRKPDELVDIGGIMYRVDPVTRKPLLAVSREGQLSNLYDTTTSKDAAGTDNTYFGLLSQSAQTRANDMQDLVDLTEAIQSGKLGTGIVEGRVALPEEMREVLYRQQLLAARGALAASGETRMTDADVEQMRQAMFGNTSTEEFNVRVLEQTLRVMQNQEQAYQRMLSYRGTQGIQAGAAAPVNNAPLGQGNTPGVEPTKRWNPETGKIEDIK